MLVRSPDARSAQFLIVLRASLADREADKNVRSQGDESVYAPGR